MFHAAGVAEQSTEAGKAPEWTVMWGWVWKTHGVWLSTRLVHLRWAGGPLWESLYLLSVCRQWGAIVESSTKFEFRVHLIGLISEECKRIHKVRGREQTVQMGDPFRDYHNSPGER